MNCVWSKDGYEDEGYYETACGETFFFADGDLADNKFRFCPYCQKPIVTSIDLKNVRQIMDKIEYVREGLRRIVEMNQSNCLGLGRSKYGTASCDHMRKQANYFLDTGDNL